MVVTVLKDFGLPTGMGLLGELEVRTQCKTCHHIHTSQQREGDEAAVL